MAGVAPKLLVASGIFHPEPGGPSTYLYELLPELQSRGWDVRALAYGDSTLSNYPYPLTRIRRQTLPFRLLRYARAARPLLTWADLVYMHTLGLPLFGSRRAKRVVKIVGDQAWERAVRKGWIAPTTDIDAFQTMKVSWQADAQRRARSREVRSLDGVIVPSQYLKRMVTGWGVPEDRIRVIYNALPPELDIPTLSQTEARTRLGLDASAPTVLTAARLMPWKGVDHLIAALKTVPDVRLLVAGDGDELPRLRALAEPLGNRVQFLGRVSREQMPLYLRAADYLALYSGYEGLSHTLLESLRVGTPVIASDKGGNPEVVQHNTNGLLVPYVDVSTLAESLRTAFQPGTRERLAANAAWGMDRFDHRQLIAQTDATLRTYL